MTFDVKYAGYVARQEMEIARQQRLSDKRIPLSFDFGAIVQLRAESQREKLSRDSTGQLGASEPHQWHHPGRRGPADAALWW